MIGFTNKTNCPLSVETHLILKGRMTASLHLLPVDLPEINSHDRLLWLIWMNFRVFLWSRRKWLKAVRLRF